MTYEEVKKMSVGDRFYEHGYGMVVEYTVTNPSVESYADQLETNQLKWKAKSNDAGEIEFLLSEKYPHYGPNIYKHSDAYINTGIV
jgi:hypothetical protein